MRVFHATNERTSKTGDSLAERAEFELSGRQQSVPRVQIRSYSPASLWVAPSNIEDLRVTMCNLGLSEKIIRNAIDGSFRAMVRDAIREDIAAAFTFAKLGWPARIVPAFQVPSENSVAE